MASTRAQVIGGNGNQHRAGVVRLQPRPGPGPGDGNGLDELPMAVGFDSPARVRPRQLRCVPALPFEPGGAAGGLVITLPFGDGNDADAPGRVSERARTTARPIRAVEPKAPTAELAPLQLTARGRVALLVVAGAIGLAVIGSAWFGAGSTTPPPGGAGPVQVVVHDGDTLWSIAGRVAPGRDPRAVVDQLLRVNHLDTPALVPGQVLRTH